LRHYCLYETYSKYKGSKLKKNVLLIMLLFCACRNQPDSKPTLFGPNPTFPSPSASSAPVPSPLPSPSPSSSPNGELTGGAELDVEEWNFITLINDYRAQNGVPKLQVSISLTKASHWLSTDMATKDYFDHTDSLKRAFNIRIASFGYPSSAYVGENIAAGNSTAQGTFTQWKNSSGHRANMLNSNYRVIGVARSRNPESTYGWYWTTDFGSKVDATIQ
jgi:uncharacterized protein YkwD